MQLRRPLHYLREGESVQFLQHRLFSRMTPMCMAYAPSGEHLAVGYAGGHVNLFNPASLALIHNLFPAPLVVRGQADLFSMAYAPNGKKKTLDWATTAGTWSSSTLPPSPWSSVVQHHTRALPCAWPTPQAGTTLPWATATGAWRSGRPTLSPWST